MDLLVVFSVPPSCFCYCCCYYCLFLFLKTLFSKIAILRGKSGPRGYFSCWALWGEHCAKCSLSGLPAQTWDPAQTWPTCVLFRFPVGSGYFLWIFFSLWKWLDFHCPEAGQVYIYWGYWTLKSEASGWVLRVTLLGNHSFSQRTLELWNRVC